MAAGTPQHFCSFLNTLEKNTSDDFLYPGYWANSLPLDRKNKTMGSADELPGLASSLLGLSEALSGPQGPCPGSGSFLPDNWVNNGAVTGAPQAQHSSHCGSGRRLQVQMTSRQLSQERQSLLCEHHHRYERPHTFPRTRKTFAIPKIT